MKVRLLPGEPLLPFRIWKGVVFDLEVKQLIVLSKERNLHFWGEPLRIGVLASGSGSNFEVIANNCEQNLLNANIVHLICNIDCAKVFQRAYNHSISTSFLDHTVMSRETLDEAIIGIFQSKKVDIIVMAGWMRKVTSILIDQYQNRIINIHPSLLPDFKGLNAVEQALDAGVKESGCTTHIVTEELDGGPILAQSKVVISELDDSNSLHKKIQTQEHLTLPWTIQMFAKFS